ncbi:MAG: alpha/beta hydrolase [Pseudobutyrivibrio ruminis]|uniref:alpha/beta hydrolase family protein n=1 Tax=Pseudobutyrivibrio ruminis TaxID=46206 RepID=UPI0026EF0811|nr:alpha/beta hydrolase [Pseudobutyrivibrio ruminis]MBE5912650.1 alpha/beta hydrolase [Pseudobutyrivibrio ruminis]
MTDIKSSFIRVTRRVPGVLYEPVDKNGKEKIAILTMHSDEDYLDFSTGPELAKRGYTALNANVMNKEGIVFSQPEKMKAVKAAVEYLKSLPQVEKVILIGHSGGGTLMSCYQAIAENGPQIFQGDNMIYPYPDNDTLPKADGIMYLDSNWGNALMQLFSLDPAVMKEGIGIDVDESLSLFSKENGFDRENTRYTKDFVQRFLKAQGERNNRLLDEALDRNANIDAGLGYYSDDEPFIITASAQGFFNNKLYAQDNSFFAHTKEEHLQLYPNGERKKEIIYSLRGADNFKSLTDSFWEGARFLSVKTYLNSYAVRTEPDYGYNEDSLWGVDFDSTYASPIGNVKHISVPTLVVGMTAGWEYIASESIYDSCASKDKNIAFIYGANHKFEPAKHLEKYPGEFGDTIKILYDFVDEWLSEDRF